MPHNVQIENIEQMRRQEGIDDVELRADLGRLRVGDSVRLTFLPAGNASAGETLLVQVTGIEGERLRGRLTTPPTRGSLSPLRAGSLVRFTRDQIHSIAKRRSSGQRSQSIAGEEHS